MNCCTARSIAEKTVEGTTEITERLELDMHLDSCPECREYCSQTSTFVNAATRWARDYTQTSDPGDSLDHKVMAAIAGRTPGQAIDYRRRTVLVSATAVASAASSIVADNYFKFSLSLTSITGDLQIMNRVTSAIELNLDGFCHKAATAPLFTNAPIIPTLAALMVLNLIVYTRPVRRILRAQ